MSAFGASEMRWKNYVIIDVSGSTSISTELTRGLIIATDAKENLLYTLYHYVWMCFAYMYIVR